MLKSFDEAITYVKNTPNNPSITDDDRLQFYKYYKQAIIGNCNTVCPSMFSFAERAKWEAWNSLKGMTQDEAKAMYIFLVNQKIS